MDKTSEAIFALKPVTFHYRSEKSNIPQFGLIAEDALKVNPIWWFAIRTAKSSVCATMQ